MGQPGMDVSGYGGLGPQVGSEEPWLPGAGKPGDELPDKAAVEGAEAALGERREVGRLAVPPPHGVPDSLCLHLVGQVEGHILLRPAIRLPSTNILYLSGGSGAEPEIDGVLIILNTVGGDIEDPVWL